MSMSWRRGSGFPDRILDPASITIRRRQQRPHFSKSCLTAGAYDFAGNPAADTKSRQQAQNVIADMRPTRLHPQILATGKPTQSVADNRDFDTLLREL